MRGLERLLKQNSGGGTARSRVGNAPIRTRLFYGGRLRTAYSRTNLGTINPQGMYRRPPRQVLFAAQGADAREGRAADGSKAVRCIVDWLSSVITAAEGG